MNTNGNNKDKKHDDSIEVRLFESSELFCDCNEIIIRHAGSMYRLRITRNDKLIMNK